MSSKSSLVNGSRERCDRSAPRYVTSETHPKAPELQRLVEIARPEQALAWRRPSDFGGAQATFYNHHFLIAGCKGLDEDRETNQKKPDRS